MRLNSFFVSNYRSIKGTKNIVLNDYTVLVGKNNEGKSNLLHALNLAIGDIIYLSQNIRDSESQKEYWRIPAHVRVPVFDYETDFPKKTTTRKKNTSIKLSFNLSEEDVLAFKQELGLNINENLTLNVEYNSRNLVKITIEKKGGRNWQKKILSIISFVANRINFIYIPAVRTADTFSDIISDELRSAILSTAKGTEYENAIRIVDDLEKKAVENISQTITSSLADWLPNVENVRIDSGNVHHSRAYMAYPRRTKLFVTSSGTETLLENKGDGVQSLFALALLAKNSINNKEKNIILAVDEPEAHLHPEAIHRLKKTILHLSDQSQVIVATHNPIFVNVNNESSNIIVDSGSVRKATSIHEIRDMLGVIVSDNLTNTNNAIAVEGETDKKFLTTVIKLFGKQSLKNKINNGTIEIRSMKGVKNLKATIGSFENQLIKFYVILDADNSAKNMLTSSLSKYTGLMANQYTYLPSQNTKTEFEIEDYYADSFITEVCNNIFGTALKNEVSFKYAKKKWSEKMENILNSEGADFANQAPQVKNELASKFSKSKDPKKLLQEDEIDKVKALVNKIEHYFLLEK